MHCPSQVLPKNASDKWKNIIYSGKKINYFLVGFISFLNHIEESLKTILERFPQIAHWFEDDFLDNLIYTQAESIIIPIILPSCVLEMHVARKHRMLIGKTSAERFTFFINALEEKENHDALLHKYPVMRQKLNTVVKQIIDVLEELFNRLNKDYKTLNKFFLKKQGKNLKLKYISASGDRHQQGREVLILTFTSKLKQAAEIKLVYKPHSMKIDIAFQKFLKWFNSCSNTLSLKTIRILDLTRQIKNTQSFNSSQHHIIHAYGYCEFINIQSCLNTTEVTNFYFRLGMLLMLSYFFLGFDLHCENILAQGEHPLIIDYECLLTPFIEYKKQRKKLKPSRHFVLNMNLLPSKEASDSPNQYLDLSGMNSDEDIKIMCWKWINPGKDTMQIISSTCKLSKTGNRPQLRGKPISITSYEQDFINGFKTAYQVILDHQSTLLDNKGPLKFFKQVRTRVVPRRTKTYEILLHEQHFPKNLLNQKSNNTHLNKLDTIKKTLPEFKKLIPSEKSDIVAETIPVFYSMSDQAIVYNSHGEALNLHVKGGLEAFIDYFKRYISIKDKQQQSELIEASFLANRLNNKIISPPNSSLFKRKDLIGNLWSQNILNQRARKLVTIKLDNLMTRSIFSGDDIFWPYFDLMKNGMYSVEMTAGNLYSGITGILLPFAYAGQLFKCKDYQVVAKHCIKTLHNFLMPPLSPSITLGFASGLGGILYVFRLIQLLGYRISIKKDIKPLFDFFKKIIESDSAYDLIDGVTGGIAGCLAWYRSFPDDIILTAMNQCVEHLLQTYPDPEILPKNFSGEAFQPLLGLAHGLTGMIWIYSHCNSILKDPQLDQWIRKAISYERAQLKMHHGIWPDYRTNLDNENKISSSATENQMIGWCSGPPGIGLAKMATLAPYKDKQFAKEIKHAIDLLLKAGIINNDCLCHGNLGNIELLYAWAKQTNSAARITHVRAFAQAICLRITKKIESPAKDEPLSPGLINGDAGIAYGLLRMIFPEVVPNILLMNLPLAKK